MEGVISVFHSHPTASRLHTTRSWDFISLLEANWDASMANGEEFLSKASYGKNVIVGVLDSGIISLLFSLSLSLSLIHE